MVLFPEQAVLHSPANKSTVYDEIKRTTVRSKFLQNIFPPFWFVPTIGEKSREVKQTFFNLL